MIIWSQKSGRRSRMAPHTHVCGDESEPIGYRHPLSPLDWLMPRTYVCQILCFPRRSDNSQAEVSQVLKDGLRGLAHDVPHLLSAVVVHPAVKGAVALRDHQTVDDLFSSHDLSHVLPSYGVLKQNHFPPSLLSASGIVPTDTEPPYMDPTPVFRARLTLVRDGLLLCVGVHHATTDITGFGALLKIWGARCRGAAAESVGFEPSWLSRRVLDCGEMEVPRSVPDLLHVREPADVAVQQTHELGQREFETCVFYFPQKVLGRLKQEVNRHVASLDCGIDWVSTGDILSALMWSAVVWAERDEIFASEFSVHGEEEMLTAGIPVNFRSRCRPPLPRDYLGAAFGMTMATAPREDLMVLSGEADLLDNDKTLSISQSASLARISVAIRNSITRVEETRVRDLLAYTASQSDISKIKLGPRHDGISLVSWADQDAYEVDWGGVLGRCEAVRLPKLKGRRYPIILPRVPVDKTGESGGMEVLVSLEKGLMNKFGASWPVKRFGNLRCR